MTGAVALLRRHLVGLGALAAAGVLAATLGAVPSASGAFTAQIRNSADTVGTATYFQCAGALGADSTTALFQWPLSDAAGAATAADISGSGRSGTYSGTVATSAATPMACPRDGGTAWSLDGSTIWAYSPAQQTNPTVFTEEIWFKTSVAGGRLMGFGTGTTDASGQYDRHLYIDRNGAVVFGVYAKAVRTVKTTGGYADGAWHQAVGTLSSSGMTLYVDGAFVVTDATVTTAENDSGYWRVGYDKIGGSWPNASTAAFTGSLRYAAVYTSALSAAQIRAHWAAGIGS